MRPIVALAASLLCTAAAAADQVIAESGGPVGTAVLIAPLPIDEAQRWQSFTVVKPVLEKEGVLYDTAEAKNQVLLVQSVTYFKGGANQLYAVITYLRPRQAAK